MHCSVCMCLRAVPPSAAVAAAAAQNIALQQQQQAASSLSQQIITNAHGQIVAIGAAQVAVGHISARFFSNCHCQHRLIYRVNVRNLMCCTKRTKRFQMLSKWCMLQLIRVSIHILQLTATYLFSDSQYVLSVKTLFGKRLSAAFYQSINARFVGRRYTTRPGAPAI